MFGLKRLLGLEAGDADSEPAVEAGMERVASLDEIPPGKGKVVVVRGSEVGVFNVDGALHAIDNICPHSYRPIGNSAFEGTQVTCLWHGLKFNVVTGVCEEAPHHEVKKYRVQVQGDDVYVGPPIHTD